MEFFGKAVSSHFDSFYDAHVAEHIPLVQVSFHEIPDDDLSIPKDRFGYTRQDPYQPGTADVHIRSGMPAADFEHCLAHELLHVVSGVLRFPVAGLALQIPKDSPLAGIVVDLNTMECVANDQLLVSLEFDPAYVSSIRVQRLRERITDHSVATDDLGNLWAVRTTIHYLRALLDSGLVALAEVRTELDKLPKIKERGDQIFSVLSQRDLQDREQRRLALVLIRGTLGLGRSVGIGEPG